MYITKITIFLYKSFEYANWRESATFRIQNPSKSQSTWALTNPSPKKVLLLPKKKIREIFIYNNFSRKSEKKKKRKNYLSKSRADDDYRCAKGLGNVGAQSHNRTNADVSVRETDARAVVIHPGLMLAFWTGNAPYPSVLKSVPFQNISCCLNVMWSMSRLPVFVLNFFVIPVYGRRVFKWYNGYKICDHGTGANIKKFFFKKS